MKSHSLKNAQINQRIGFKKTPSVTCIGLLRFVPVSHSLALSGTSHEHPPEQAHSLAFFPTGDRSRLRPGVSGGTGTPGLEQTVTLPASRRLPSLETNENSPSQGNLSQKLMGREQLMAAGMA